MKNCSSHLLDVTDLCHQGFVFLAYRLLHSSSKRKKLFYFEEKLETGHPGLKITMKHYCDGDIFEHFKPTDLPAGISTESTPLLSILLLSFTAGGRPSNKSPKKTI